MLKTKNVSIKNFATLMFDSLLGNNILKKIYKKVVAHRGARTHDHKIKSLALYRLS